MSALWVQAYPTKTLPAGARIWAQGDHGPWGKDYSDADPRWLRDEWRWVPSVVVADAAPDESWQPLTAELRAWWAGRAWWADEPPALFADLAKRAPDGLDYHAATRALDDARNTSAWAITISPEAPHRAWIGIGGDSRQIRQSWDTFEPAEAAARAELDRRRAGLEWTGELRPVKVLVAPSPGWAHWERVPMEVNLITGERRPVDPVGIAEIADMLGVQRKTVDMWRLRGVLPEPEWMVSGSPAWPRQTIIDWAAETGRAPNANTPNS